MWTLVGGGIKSFEQTGKPMGKVLPKNATWLKTKAVSFNPDQNKLTTEAGDEISYEFLVIAMGLTLDYGQVRFFCLQLSTIRSQSFTALMADLCQDLNRVSSFSRYHNGTFS